MGVVIQQSTIIGGFTPICNMCGATEDYDISQLDYDSDKKRWDDYICIDCKNFIKYRYNK